MNLFVTGQEKDFGPDDKRKLQQGEKGKLRWHKKEKSKLKDRNSTQLEILKLAEVPEKDIADYVLDSVADGQKLGEYADQVIGGKITKQDAASRVKTDYTKMKTGKKEAPHLQDKQPYEMTWDEYREDIVNNNKSFKRIPKSKENIDSAIKYIKSLHRGYVKRALSEGKQVPEEVLKDYPGLHVFGEDDIQQLSDKVGFDLTQPFIEDYKDKWTDKVKFRLIGIDEKDASEKYILEVIERKNNETDGWKKDGHIFNAEEEWFIHRKEKGYIKPVKKKTTKSYHTTVFGSKLFKSSALDVIEGEVKRFGRKDLRILRRTKSGKRRFVDYDKQDEKLINIGLSSTFKKSKLIRSEEFKKWFGDWENEPGKCSRVTNRKGQPEEQYNLRPIPVYHGSMEDFDEFKLGDIGFHFGTREQAISRLNKVQSTRRLKANSMDVAGGNVKEFYLNIRNPLEMSDVGDWDNPNDIIVELIVGKYFPKDDYELDSVIMDEAAELAKKERPDYEELSSKEKIEASDQHLMILLKKFLKKRGYDGIKYLNAVEGTGLSWIAFDPTQIKSTENEGEFDSKNPNFYKSKAMQLLKAFGQQINMFNSGAYGREGETKPGRGGTLKLDKDKSGKGAHWRLLDKKQSEGRTKREEESPQPVQQKKILNNTTAYNALADKLGNKATVSDKRGNPMGEGTFQLMNENGDGSSTLFIKNKEGQTNAISVPGNQAVMQVGDDITFQFSDRDVSVSLTERGAEDVEQIDPDTEERKAEQLQEWEMMASNYVREAEPQKNRYLQDLDEVSKENGLEEFSNEYRHLAVKSKESILTKFERNEARGQSEKNKELTDTLRGTIKITNPSQYNALMISLKKRGYEVWNDNVDNLYDDERPGYKHIAVKLSKGKSDPVIKELIMITPNMHKAKSGFGHDLYDVEKNVDIALGKKIDSNHPLYPELQKFHQAVRRITNEFYGRAYKADQRLFPGESEDGTASADSSKAPPVAQDNKNSRKDSSGYSEPPKRLMRSLRSSLKAILQPLSQSAINSSGDLFSLGASSLAIGSTLGSIVNPTKNIVSKFASNVSNLFKSSNKNVIIRKGLDMNGIKIFGKRAGTKKNSVIKRILSKSIFGKAVNTTHLDGSKEVDTVALENEHAGGIPCDQLPDGTRVKGFESAPYQVNYDFGNKHCHIWQDPAEADCYYVNCHKSKSNGGGVPEAMDRLEEKSLEEANAVVLEYLKK